MANDARETFEDSAPEAAPEPLELTAANDEDPLLLDTLADAHDGPAETPREPGEEFGDLPSSPTGWQSAELADEDPPFDAPDPDDEIFHFRSNPAQTDEYEAAEQSQASSSPRAPEPVVRAVRPAPAIAVHVAWDRPGCDDLLTALAADARLARIELTDAPGSIAGAAARFSKTASPDLLILHTNLSGPAMCAELDRLTCALSPRTKTIVIGAINDVALLRELARRNIAHYMLAPAEPDEVVRTICELYEDGDNSRVIAVVGARGGVGASTIAHNLAWVVAERLGASATLVELDLAFGAAAFNLNHRPAQSIADGLAAPDRLDEAFLDSVAIDQTQRLRLLPGPAALNYDARPDPRAIGALIRNVRRMSAFVILDLPHDWSGWTKDILVRADEVVVVATPDLASLRNSKNFLDVLKAARPPEREPLLALSMTGGDGPEISLKDFTGAVGATPAVTFAFDPALFGACAIKGQMVVESAPKSKAAETFDELAWVLTGRRPAKDLPKRKSRSKPRTAEETRDLLLTPAASPASTADAAPPLILVDKVDTPVCAEEPPPTRKEEPLLSALPSSTVSTPKSPSPPVVVSAPRRARHRRLLRTVKTPRPRRGRPGTVRVALMLVALVIASAWFVQRAPAATPPPFSVVSGA